MSKRFVNTFSGGIDRDTSVNKYDNTHYYDAENIRPISNNTFTSGAISNVDGLLQKIDFNSITYDNLSSTSTISSIAIYKVVPIRDAFIFFAVGDLTEDTQGLYSGTNFIIKGTPNSNGDFTSLTLVYMYAGDGFTADLSVVSRYESESIQKVYWADGINPLRSINILNTTLGSLTVPTNDPKILDHVPEVSFSRVQTLGTVSGGRYSSGVVQYAYQLYNVNGSITTISPVSSPVALSSVPESEIGGSDIGENTNKSVRVSIANIDNRFTRIRVLALFYEELFQNPTVNVVYEGINNGSVSLIDTGDPIDTLTYEEFLVFNNTVYIPQSIETKNNVLFAANVKEATFQSDILDNPESTNYWDSRAYMFEKNETFTSIVLNDGSTSTISDADWDNVDPREKATVEGVLDPIIGNNYFSSSLLDYNRLSTRFKHNSSVEGGEGPNIEFEYEINQEIIDDTEDAYKYPNITTTKQNITGLQPGDVYRFGIVFYNSKGQSSFVKWIQDIRIPYPENLDTLLGFVDYDSSNRILANHINIVFSIKPGKEPWINDPSIKAWQIVRVKRSEQDREILYNGILNATDVRDSDEFSRSYLNYRDSNAATTQYYSGKPLTSVDYPDTGTGDRCLLWEFLSPEINFNKSVKNISESDLIINYYLSSAANSAIESDRHDIYYTKYNLARTWPEFFQNTTIDRYKYVKPATFTGDPSEGRIYDLGDTNKERYLNLTRPEAALHDDNIGIGGSKLVINSNLFPEGGIDVPLLPENSNLFPDTGWDISTTFYQRAIYGSILQDVSASRYGGSSYEARQYNEYIPYSDIVPSTSNSTYFTDKYNGDVYIKMFVYLRNIAQEDYPNEWGDKDGLQELVIFPVHTSINLDYRNDNILKYITLEPSGGTSETGDLNDMWVQETVQMGIAYQPDLYDESIGDLYSYNSVYSKQNEAKKFYPKPFDFVEEDSIDTKVSASEVKTNGEYIDSWTRFKSSNFLEVDSAYGSITELKRFMNRLYCFQQDAISLLAVNDRSLIRDDSGIQLALGTGGILERYDYITTTTGLQRKSALADSKRALYFIDEYNKELWALQGSNSQELSRIKGFSSKINSLIPSDKILVGFDPNFNEIYLTFDNETWVFSEVVGSVIGKFSINPDLYFHNRGLLYSVTDSVMNKNNDPSSKLGAKSYITLLINPNSNIINTFDNLDFRTETSILDNTGYIRGIKIDYTIDDNNISSGENFIAYSGETLVNTDDEILSDILLEPKAISEFEKTITISYIGDGDDRLLFKLKTLNLRTIGANVTNAKIYVTVDFDRYELVETVSSIPATTSYPVDFTGITPNIEFSGLGTVDRIIYENSYIDPIIKSTKLSDPNKTVSHLARAFRTQVPQTSDGNRFVDSYLLATFEFDNIDNIDFKLHDVITYYRETKI